MPNKFLYWSPRILSVLFVVFLSMFSLDVFNGSEQGWAIIPGLLMHLLIPFIMLLAAIAAWKWDLAGTVIFFGFAIYYVWMVGLDRHFSWYLSISGPAVVIAILFLLNYLRKKPVY
ncbi:MAG: hypothetical protein WC435_03835 [Candidatus Paceibacterota bacterium]